MRPTRGAHENNFSKQNNQVTKSGPKGTLPQEWKPKQPKDKENLGIVKPLEFFYELNKIEDNLLELINKRNDTQYINGIVNFPNYNLTNSEKSVLSKGLGFCSTPGAPDIGNIIQDLDTFKRKLKTPIILFQI